jgi:myo-inositol catabolism protein IolC
MSTVAEINKAIHHLKNEELRAVEKTIIQEYRERKVGIIFDDTYGTLTEEDLRAIQDDALRVIDEEPSRQ